MYFKPTGYIGRDIKTSSSRCLGLNTSLQCALETYMVCQQIWDRDACDKKDRNLYRASFEMPDIIQYKLLRHRPLTSQDMDDLKQTSLFNSVWSEKDEVVFVAVRYCEPSSPPSGKCEDRGKTYAGGRRAPFIYIVKQRERGDWMVTGSFTAQELDESFEFAPKQVPQKLLKEGLTLNHW